MWASGESDVNLMDRAMGIYEEEHKKDGPFMFKHCWNDLRKQPKWDAYLERLDEPESDKRKSLMMRTWGNIFLLLMM